MISIYGPTQDTKLDVLNILANVSFSSKKGMLEVRTALQGVSEWFDEYMAKEESTPGQVKSSRLFPMFILKYNARNLS